MAALDLVDRYEYSYPSRNIDSEQSQNLRFCQMDGGTLTALIHNYKVRGVYLGVVLNHLKASGEISVPDPLRDSRDHDIYQQAELIKQAIGMLAQEIHDVFDGDERVQMKYLENGIVELRVNESFYDTMAAIDG